MPAKKQQNLVLYAGSAERFTITVLTGTGAARNISSASLIEWRMAKNELSTDTPILEKTLAGGGIVIDDGPAGELSVLLTTSDTDTLTHGEYYHECRLTLAGQIKTITTGKVTVYDSVFAPSP